MFAVPWSCLAQFSIQGPSDGNRQAQGLKYSADKGIEYTDKSGKYKIHFFYFYITFYFEKKNGK